MIEKEILCFLFKDSDIFIYYFAHIKKDFFFDMPCKAVFGLINRYYEAFKTMPSLDSIEIDMKAISTNGHDKTRDEALEVINWVRNYNPEVTLVYKKSLLEKWIKQSALRNAIYKSSEIINSVNPDFDKMFSMVKSAVSINFDRDYGIDFFDIEAKVKLYGSSEKKYPFLMNEWNRVSEYGFEPGNLHVIAGPPGFGKSRAMISMACDYARQGFKCFYMTMEMNTKSILRRMDANLLELDYKHIPDYTKDFDKYLMRHDQTIILDRTGNLIVKKFPNTNTSMNDIRFFVEDFFNKFDNFKPEIIFIDYIGTMVPNSKIDNGLYENGKSIAGEMRGFADDFRMNCVSACQFNSEGIKGNISLATLGESRAIGHIADDIWAIHPDPDCTDNTAHFMTILKTRYSSFTNYKFKVGVKKDQFRLVNYDDAFINDVVKPASMVGNKSGVKFNERRQTK